MNAGYIDTSFLLSIIFEDENFEQSAEGWNTLDTLFSSVLLEIEARINLYKHFLERRMEKTWYQKSEKTLQELLDSIHRRAVDDEIVQEIRNYDQLKKARSLDGIHLATANIFNKLTDNKLLLCSYDKRMIEIGSQIGLQIL